MAQSKRKERESYGLVDGDNTCFQEGSITVFMTFVFLLLFALTGVSLDSARFFSSGGYMKVSAYGASVAMYGNYNRELFQEYALLGYGGHGGLGEADWIQEYSQILSDNLAEKPSEESSTRAGFFPRRYASVYQLRAIEADLEKVGVLTEENYFMEQVEAWMKTTVVKDISSHILQYMQETQKTNPEELIQGLEETAELEKRKKEKERREKEKQVESKRNNATDNGQEDSSLNPGEEKEKKNSSSQGKKNQNPFSFLKKLMRDGVLTLVCDENNLAEGQVSIRKKSGEWTGEEKGKKWDSRKSASGILKGLLKQSDSLEKQEAYCHQAKKGKLLLYVSQMFDSYVSQRERAIPYGLEYLVTGETSQKEAFGKVVDRLFLLRTLLNYSYVNSNPVFQEESLTTATTIAAPLGAEALIPAIQQGILLILSLEESCVDITALLDGKQVPLIKNQTNFKMTYGEICLAGKALFSQKASVYPAVQQGLQEAGLSQGLGYIHYLWLMLLMTKWDLLFQRTLDLIQDDLRTRYNQSFTLEQCICKTKIRVSYGIPLLSSVFLVREPERMMDSEKEGLVFQRISVSYGYH